MLQFTSSAYEVKKKLLISNAFESKEEWCFPFWNILFSILEIFTFLYYTNDDQSDDVINSFT